jgi:hypothetical protein
VLSRPVSKPLTVTFVTAAVLVLAASAALPASGAGGATGPTTFAPPQYIDTQIGGGEPTIFYDKVHALYVYTAHEGTTHTLVMDGVTAPQADADWVTNYRNQVNIWTSPDALHWTRTDLAGTGFTSNPANNTGFSDPDIAQDESGRIYNTGIDLVNDALYSSPDGGKTWDKGTPQCHQGDRPWLAAGPPNTVWLATDPTNGSHSIFMSTDGGASCSQTGIADSIGNGKLFYDDVPGSALYGALIEPVNSSGGKVGISVLPDAVGAFAGTAPKTFTFKPAASFSRHLEHWPSISLDTAGNVYLTWDDNPTEANGANSIWLSMTKDGGDTWTTPVQVAHPGSTVMWPWVAAGTPGNASVVYYQYDQPLTSISGAPDTAKMSVMNSNVFGIDTDTPTIDTVDAAGRPVHVGPQCTSGTTCEASGDDRRLGDYFTNWLDADGCAIIATGDTMVPDGVSAKDRPWSLPLFLHQNSGPSLTGGVCGASVGPQLPETPWTIGLPLAAFSVMAAVLTHRRRRGVPIAG